MVTDKTRRSAFIEQNLGLVHACAGRFRGRGIEYDDLYGAGCMGLVKATDGFDEGRGLLFYLCSASDPGRDQKAFPGGRHSQGQPLLKRTGAAGQCGAGTSQEALRHRADPFSTGRRAGGERGEHHACDPGCTARPEPDPGENNDRQIDIPVESPEEELADKIGLAEVLESLPEEDRLLIRLRFYANRTQSETAKVLHTTQVQISRRERKILRKMRERLLE